MAGKQQMMPMSGGKTVPKIMTTLCLIAALVLVVKHPADAAAVARTIWQVLCTVIEGLAAFFRAVSR